ncbi:hypothetical protein cypCar_00019638 [Cyprinus carpio]|nr:hypothetical protein cypCar_00019638 [Cyprinus carpio]
MRPCVRRCHKVDDPIDMLPKSRKALSIQEIAALARSSFNGISQVVKDHVTKPTAMAQGRVAHLIEWKGWSKPSDPPSATLQSHFNSYSHLSEGEQEARFAADAVFSNQSCPVPSQAETDTAEIPCSDSTLSQSEADDPLMSEEVPPHAQELQLSEGEGDSSTCAVHKPERRPLWSKGDSCYYSTSYSESGLSPEDEEEEEDGREVEEGEDSVFQDVIRWYRHCRSISDTSGAVSFDEEGEEEEQEEGSKQ